MRRMTARSQPQPRSHFAHFQAITTRWMDNDIYGHVNNVVHYSFFDTAVNRYLIEAGALDIHAGAVIGLVVQTQCHYFDSLAFPQTVHAGIRVAHLGRSSVRYELGLFADDAPLSAAVGSFVHVYVDRASRRPVPVPDALRAALSPLLRPSNPPVGSPSA
jgi:acyl-CoA thioester hydrolase